MKDNQFSERQNFFFSDYLLTSKLLKSSKICFFHQRDRKGNKLLPIFWALMHKLWKLVIAANTMILLLLVLVIFAKPSLLKSGLFSSNENEEFNYGGQFLSQRVYAGERVPPLPMNYAPLKEYLRQNISPTINFSLYLQDLNTGASMGIEEYRRFDPASLNKLMLAVIILKQVELGGLDLDQPVELHRASGYGDLYLSPESHLPLRLLLKEMLENSDNTAFFSLVSLVDLELTQKILHHLDLDDPETASLGESHYMLTPRSMYNVFHSLYYSTLLSPEHSGLILYHLSHNTNFNIKEKVELSSDEIIAHKTGAFY
ncbi:MAG: serine hydrolase, partial [Candidatus Daviesbacteria bacterium]|nr:serine hydrolase [Candidatus Daviesbacteria bacterium]